MKTLKFCGVEENKLILLPSAAGLEAIKSRYGVQFLEEEVTIAGVKVKALVRTFGSGSRNFRVEQNVPRNLTTVRVFDNAEQIWEINFANELAERKENTNGRSGETKSSIGGGPQQESRTAGSTKAEGQGTSSTGSPGPTKNT